MTNHKLPVVVYKKAICSAHESAVQTYHPGRPRITFTVRPPMTLRASMLNLQSNLCKEVVDTGVLFAPRITFLLCATVYPILGY